MSLKFNATGRNLMKKIWLMLPAFLLVWGCNFNNHNNSFFTTKITSELDSLISSIMSEEELPSVAISIEVDGDIYNYNAGYENMETLTERKLDSPFRIASITKTFTGTLILMLANEGQLSINDPLIKYFPDFPNAENISLKNLLMMRSGITDYADADFLKLIYDDPFLEFEQDSLIAMSAEQGDTFTDPDEKTEYRNINFTLLGRIVEIITKNDLKTEFNNRIIIPYGMTNTYYPSAGDYTLPETLRGYSREEDTFKDITELNPLWAGAAGAMISTLADLRIFAREMFFGFNLTNELQDERLQTKAFFEQPDWFAYGEGICRLGDFWGHNGTIFGFSTEMWYLPEMDATIIINVNRLDLDDHSKSTSIFLQVSKLLFPEHVQW